MILHTVNKSPFSDNSFAECLKFCSKGASILLIENGVYAGKKDTLYSQQIEQHSDIHFYALSADIEARGLSGELSPVIKTISDKEFVELAVSHHSVQSWF